MIRRLIVNGWTMCVLFVGLGVLATTQARAFPDSFFLGPAPSWLIIGAVVVVGVVYIAFFLLASGLWNPGQISPPVRPAPAPLNDSESVPPEPSLLIPDQTVPLESMVGFEAQFSADPVPTPIPPAQQGEETS